MVKKLFLRNGANRYLVLCPLLLIIVSHAAYAAAPEQLDPASFENASYGFQHFYQNVAPYVERIVTSSAITGFSLTLWKFFSFMLIVWKAAEGVHRGYDLGEIISLVFIISVVRILMLNYDQMTATFWSWSEGMATSIQVSAIGVDDQFFGPRYMWNLITSINFQTGNIVYHINAVIASLVLGLFAVVLSILAFFSSAWALWGYSIAKMIGLVFLPFILFERLSWLFDGWVRFFFGFLVYNIIAKLMLMMAIFAMSAYFNIPADTVPQHQGYNLVITTLWDILGLLVFMGISIIGLLFTGAFVKTLVSGASVGSLGSGAQSLRQGVQQAGQAIAAVLI